MELLAAHGGAAALSELARGLQLSRSTVHGILATMRRRGLVSQDPLGRYVLGLKLFEWGNLAVARLDLRAVAAPVLQHLVEQFQETVHLVVGDGPDVVYIDKRESLQSIRIASQVGWRLPAHCTGVGKALLAARPEPELDQLLDSLELQPLTANTITDRQRLRAHLREVAQRGYALDDEEIVVGLRCVAAPLRDHTGAAIAALSVSGPTVRMTLSRLEEIAPAVVAAAAEISRQLGYTGVRAAPPAAKVPAVRAISNFHQKTVL